MALVTTIADPTADSYCTVVEADSYLEARGESSSMSTSSWGNLDDAHKELRLTLAAQCMDSMLRFRGVKATLAQARAFPRIFPQDILFSMLQSSSETTSSGVYAPFATWTDLTEYAGLIGATVPDIPTAVKQVQIEIAFQVIHTQLLSLDSFQAGDVSVQSINLAGALQVTMSNSDSTKATFSKQDFDSLAIVKLMLGSYLAPIRIAQP